MSFVTLLIGVIIVASLIKKAADKQQDTTLENSKFEPKFHETKSAYKSTDADPDEMLEESAYFIAYLVCDIYNNKKLLTVDERKKFLFCTSRIYEIVNAAVVHGDYLDECDGELIELTNSLEINDKYVCNETIDGVDEPVNGNVKDAVNFLKNVLVKANPELLKYTEVKAAVPVVRTTSMPNNQKIKNKLSIDENLKNKNEQKKTDSTALIPEKNIREYLGFIESDMQKQVLNIDKNWHLLKVNTDNILIKSNYGKVLTELQNFIAARNSSAAEMLKKRLQLLLDDVNDAYNAEVNIANGRDMGISHDRFMDLRIKGFMQ